MGSTSKAQHLLGFSGTCAAAHGAAALLEEALPALLVLSGADAALVVRRETEGHILGQATGAPLGAAEVEPPAVAARGVLHRVDVPESWRALDVDRVEVQRLPGHHGVLALAWVAPAAASTSTSTSTSTSIPLELGIAVSLLESTLARLEATTELRDLATRVDNAQHLAHMGDYDWHIASNTNRWSDELFRIYGHEPQTFEPSYEKFISLIHPDDRERITGIHQRAYSTGEPFAMTERIVRPDGEIRYLSSNGEVVRDDHGVPVRMRGTCIDITDRVHAERERERFDARYRVLVDAAPDAILVLDHSGHVLDANPQACALLAGDPTERWMGDFGALEADGLGIDLTRLDGSTVLVDVTRVELSPGGNDSAHVAVYLRDTSSRLAGEELAALHSQAQLRRRQALEINDNVVQGLVAAAYALDAEQYPVVATYIDRTLWAARTMMDELLEPLDGQDLTPGDLVRSEPARIGVPEGMAVRIPPQPASESSHDRRVLVVDDADDLRRLMRDRLERTDGYTVVGEAGDGIVAVELARELQPDLVLLDLAMPRMDGLEALPLIRQAVPDVRVVVFSGFNQNTLAEKAMQAGADRYVVKGGSLRELISLLDAVLKTSR
jgi:PAS domain S-box-containing protein